MDALYALAIPAIVKLVELINKKEWSSAGKIVLSATVGTLAGFLGIGELTIITGLAAGLTASGLVTIASYAGKR